MRSEILAAVLASLSLGACSMADEVVAPPEPTLSIVLPQRSSEDGADTSGADWHGLAAVRVDGGLLQKVEEGYPEVTFWDVVASIAPGSASVQGWMRYSGNRGTMSLTMRLWKGPDPLLTEPVSGSQGGGIYPPLPFGWYSFYLAHTINLPSELQCGITNNAAGRFQSFFDLPAIPNALQSEVQQDWDSASLPLCPVTKPYESGGTGGTVYWVKVCYVLDHYDAWGEYSYTEEVQCWAVAYTTGGEPPQWEI